MLTRNNVLSQQIPMKESFLPNRNCIFQIEKQAVFPVNLTREKNQPNTNFLDQDVISTKTEMNFQ